VGQFSFPFRTKHYNTHSFKHNMADGVFLLPQNSNVGGAQQGLSFLRGQDAFLKIDPARSLFSSSVSKVSNFVTADYDQIITSGQSIVGAGWDASQNVTILIPKAGDILTDVKLNFLLSGFAQRAIASTDPVYNVWTPGIGYAILGSSLANQLLIGSTPFEPITDIYSIMHDQLLTPESQRGGESIGDYAQSLRFTKRLLAAGESPVGSDELGGVSAAKKFSSRNRNIVANLPLFFTREVENGLNIVGLQGQDVSLQMQLRSRSDCIVQVTQNNVTGAVALSGTIASLPAAGASLPGNCMDFKLQCRFAYLDGPERQFFSQSPFQRLYHPHYMLTQSVSGLPGSGTTSSYTISNVLMKFNQPTTATMVAYRSSLAETNHEWLRFGAYSSVRYTEVTSATVAQQLLGPQEIVDPISAISFQANQNSLFSETTDNLRLYVPRKYGGGVPNRMLSLWAWSNCASDARLSGSLNFSAIDNPTFNFTFRPCQGHVVASGASTVAQLGGYTNSLSSGFAIADVAADVTSGTIFVVNKQINIYRQSGGAIGSLYGS
jgi:hypothetical protein